MKTCRQLTQEQRYQVYALKKARLSQTEIARVVGVHKSTISRELKRNSGKPGYRPKQAQRITSRRRRAKVRFRISLAEWNRIDALIRQDWSPEQVSGRLRKEATAVSHEWTYQHITTDTWRGGDLHTHLRYRNKGSGPVQPIAGARSPTVCPLMSVQLWSISGGDYATGDPGPGFSSSWLGVG